MPLPTVTMQARVVDDPELRFAPSGVAVAKIRCVASSRRKNKDTDEWEDGDKFWIWVTCFKQMAENVAESVTKGQLINVVGKIKTDEWEDKDGNKRSAPSMIADTIGPALDYDTAKVTKVQRSGAGGAPAAEQDPWAAPAADEPPF